MGVWWSNHQCNSSPIQFEDCVICISGYRSAFGVSIPIRSEGDVTDSATADGRFSKGHLMLPSPALSRGRVLFTAGNNGLLSCIDAKSGKTIVDRKRINGVLNIYASPLVANGHVYLVGEDGATAVFREDTFEPVAVNSLEGTFDASPVSVGGQLLLRSWKRVYSLSESTK